MMKQMKHDEPNIAQYKNSGQFPPNPHPTAVLSTPGVTSDSRMYVARASLEAREGDEKKAMKILQATVAKDNVLWKRSCPWDNNEMRRIIERLKELMGLRSVHFHACQIAGKKDESDVKLCSLAWSHRKV